jgi:hypothetical protein
MAEVNVRIKAQNQTRTGFQQALGDAQRFGTTASGSLSSAFSGVASDIKSSIGGALAGLASIGALKSVIDQFGRIQDLSDQFGVSAETLQRFGQLASESGSSIDQMASAFSRLTINIQKAQSETGAQADAMRTLGLSVSQMANLSPEQAFLKLADALKNSGGGNEAYAATLALIGNRQQNLIPLLQQGSEAIRAQSQSISVASDETVAKVDAMADRFQRLGQQLAVGFGPAIALIGEKLLGGFAVIEAAVAKFTTAITSSVSAIGEAAKGNFAGAAAIMRAEAERTGQQWTALVDKLNQINAPPVTKQGRGAVGAIEAQLDEQAGRDSNTRSSKEDSLRQQIKQQEQQNRAAALSDQQKLDDLRARQAALDEMDRVEKSFGAQKSFPSKDERSLSRLKNLGEIAQLQKQIADASAPKGPEFGPGTAEAAAGGFRVDAAMFRPELGPELGPGTADAVAGGFRVDAAQFRQQQAEEAARLMAQQQQAFEGASAASSLQRVGLASNEFFDASANKTTKAINDTTAIVRRIATLLENSEGLYLERN